jgi:hypothetical protein
MHVQWAWELLLSPCPLPLELGAYTARRSACCAAPAHVYLYAAHGSMCALWQKAGWEGWQGLFVESGQWPSGARESVAATFAPSPRAPPRDPNRWGRLQCTVHSHVMHAMQV